MSTRTQGLRPRVAWSYAVLNVFLVAAIYALPSYHVYLWGLLGLGSAAAIVVGIACNRPDHRSAWVVIALGVTVFALGDITYDVLTKYLHEVNPYPSLADVFYLATYPLLAAGLVLIVRARRRGDGEGGAALDALIVTAGLGALSWIFLIRPYVHDADMTWFVKATSIAYPLGDILLLCVL
ncbi:MAG: GGDEF domain-containing protein, partial [Acidimicrobiales bacterium]